MTDDGIFNPEKRLISETLLIGSNDDDVLVSNDEGGILFGNFGNDLLTLVKAVTNYLVAVGDDILQGGGGNDQLIATLKMDP